jgi:hypothetical protein
MLDISLNKQEFLPRKVGYQCVAYPQKYLTLSVQGFVIYLIKRDNFRNACPVAISESCSINHINRLLASGNTRYESRKFVIVIQNSFLLVTSEGPKDIQKDLKLWQDRKVTSPVTNYSIWTLRNAVDNESFVMLLYCTTLTAFRRILCYSFK